MKNIIYILIILTFFSSCTEQNKEKKSESTPEIKVSDMESVQLDTSKISNDILLNWSNYYKSLDSSFSLGNFSLERTDTLNFIRGNVFGIFDEEFDPIYTDFIVFSPNQKRYIDFDSYQWTIDKDNIPIFSPDQEINLIDLNKQTITRIGFNGPLQWVENAFWENDSTIVLLKNSSEGELIISKIDILNRYQKIFKYQGTLHVNSKYSELRLSSKGLKIE
ncbi:MAG: hypothetical protein COA58_11545 [Bacteroidetes bacterium]|nr:MAG: hypothetical protein COA58_11545 [Bacteroidota bacterium]